MLSVVDYFKANRTCFDLSLLNRKQHVHVNGVASEVYSTSTVIPQGSTLGPLLFIIFVYVFAIIIHFINDFPSASDLVSFFTM